VEPFRSVNSYGLFRVMTTSRPEIVIERSDDGRASSSRTSHGSIGRCGLPR